MKKYIDFILEKKQDFNKKLIDEFDKIKVYEVDGEKVRNSSEIAEEFGLASSHPYFPDLIPDNEIWIENDVKEKERFVLIQNELFKLKKISTGMEKWKAYRKAETKEKIFRNKIKSSKENPEKTSEKEKDGVHVKKYGKISDITVWLVDANKIRDKWKSDFMEGGHGYVYKWIPNDEIWIEDGIKKHEIPFIILHEFVERTLMKEKNMSYEKAHDISAKVEWSKRPNNFNKEDALNLTENEVLTNYCRHL